MSTSCPRGGVSILHILHVSSVLLLLHVCLSGVEAKHDWSYDESQGNGPSNWEFLDHSKCNGKYQSPININRPKSTHSLSLLSLHGYDQQLSDVVLVNNGHSVQLSSNMSNATLSGGCLQSKYRFLQLHFHWGKNDSVGSEHLVDGKAYSMEGHFVHWNTKYKPEEAKKYADGLAVLAVFYKSRESKVQKLESLVKAVEKVEDAGQKVPVGSVLTLRTFLPDDLSSFYCYEKGSLTTPNCEEVVTWTLLKDTAPIGRKQLEDFRDVRFPNGKHMVDNFRPVQPLNDRVVYYHSSATFVAPSQVLLALLLTLLFSWSRADNVVPLTHSCC